MREPLKCRKNVSFLIPAINKLANYGNNNKNIPLYYAEMLLTMRQIYITGQQFD